MCLPERTRDSAKTMHDQCVLHILLCLPLAVYLVLLYFFHPFPSSPRSPTELFSNKFPVKTLRMTRSKPEKVRFKLCHRECQLTVHHFQGTHSIRIRRRFMGRYD